MDENIAPFRNLSSAGEELAATLAGRGISRDVIVIGIVSAGVPVAVDVTKRLEAELDLIISG